MHSFFELLYEVTGSRVQRTGTQISLWDCYLAYHNFHCLPNPPPPPPTSLEKCGPTWDMSWVLWAQVNSPVHILLQTGITATFHQMDPTPMLHFCRSWGNYFGGICNQGAGERHAGVWIQTLLPGRLVISGQYWMTLLPGRLVISGRYWIAQSITFFIWTNWVWHHFPHRMEELKIGW